MVLLSRSSRGKGGAGRARTLTWGYLRPVVLNLLCVIVILANVTSSLAAEMDARAPIPAPIAALTVTTATGTVTVRQESAAWQIVAPVMTTANQQAVGHLVDAITTCVFTPPSVPPAPVPDADQPQMTLHLQLRDGTIVPRIAIGSATAHGTVPWVRYGDDAPAWALTPDCLQPLHADLGTLRSMTVVPISLDDIVQIAVHGSGVATSLARDGQTWQVQVPTVSPADHERVQTFLTQLRDLTARATIDQPAASLRLYGLAPPRFTVTIVGRDGQMHTVAFGRGSTMTGVATHWYARRQHDDTILRLDQTPLDAWATALADLRDLRLPVTDAPDMIRVIQVERPGSGAVSLLREPDGQWTLSGQRRASIDATAVARFVTALTSLRGTTIIADAPETRTAYGLAQPNLTIRALDGQGTSLGTLLLTRPDAQAQRPCYGMRLGSTRVLAFEPWVYDILNLRTRDVLVHARPDADVPRDESWADEEPPQTAIAPAGRLRSLTRQATAQ